MVNINDMGKINIMLTAVFLLAGLHTKTMAQSNATTTASANVVQNLEVGGESQSLDFGDIIAGTKKRVGHGNTVDTFDGGIVGGEQRGYISIETAGGNSVDLSLAVPSTLEDENSNTVSVTFEVNDGNGNPAGYLEGRITETDPAGGELGPRLQNMAVDSFEKGSGTWSLKNSFQMPAGGIVYLLLGGEVSTDTNQTVGSYSGDVTITATINN